jgi:hypothetical protein
MGFMDKLKGAVNAVTGGGAKVLLEFSPAFVHAGDTVKVKVTVTSTGTEVTSAGCFVDLLGREEVRVKPSGQSSHHTESATSLDQAFPLAPAFVLAPNETKVFEGSFQMPAGHQPSFTGAHSKHEWQIRGRIDVKGNDPDSGYQTLRVGLTG